MMTGVSECVVECGGDDRSPVAGSLVSEARRVAFLRVSAQALGLPYDSLQRALAGATGRRTAPTDEAVAANTGAE